MEAISIPLSSEKSASPHQMKASKRQSLKTQNLARSYHSRDQCFRPKNSMSNKRVRDSAENDKKRSTIEFPIVDSGSHIPKEMEFSGSAFSVSPPPSSVPLPKFCVRLKLSCNVDAAAGIDAGATDNLRRLLRLR